MLLLIDFVCPALPTQGRMAEAYGALIKDMWGYGEDKYIQASAVFVALVVVFAFIPANAPV